MPAPRSINPPLALPIWRGSHVPVEGLSRLPFRMSFGVRVLVCRPVRELVIPVALDSPQCVSAVNRCADVREPATAFACDRAESSDGVVPTIALRDHSIPARVTTRSTPALEVSPEFISSVTDAVAGDRGLAGQAARTHLAGRTIWASNAFWLCAISGRRRSLKA